MSAQRSISRDLNHRECSNQFVSSLSFNPTQLVLLVGDSRCRSHTLKLSPNLSGAEGGAGQTDAETEVRLCYGRSLRP